MSLISCVASALKRPFAGRAASLPRSSRLNSIRAPIRSSAASSWSATPNTSGSAPGIHRSPRYQARRPCRTRCSVQWGAACGRERPRGSRCRPRCGCQLSGKNELAPRLGYQLPSGPCTSTRARYVPGRRISVPLRVGYHSANARRSGEGVLPQARASDPRLDESGTQEFTPPTSAVLAARSLCRSSQGRADTLSKSGCHTALLRYGRATEVIMREVGETR